MTYQENRTYTTTRNLMAGGLHSAARLLTALLLLAAGASETWGQTHPYEGVWYMQCKQNNSYYMVPAANPQVTTANHVNEDAFFSSDYSVQDGDPEKPFITTYPTSQDLNSIWIFVPVTDEDNYYYIVHALTGKYVKYQTYLTGDNARRKYIHLETMSTPGETEKFEITALNTGVKIRPKSNEMYFNVAGNNQNRYNGGTSNPYHSGMVGGMKGTDDNSQFNLIVASSSANLTPVISDVNTTTGTFTITSPAAAFSTIHYTTDGSTTPDASTGTSIASGGSIVITDSWTVQAVGVFGSFVTPVATKALTPGPCVAPIITFDNITSQVSIACITEGSTIYYTTDGSTPTTSSTEYGDPFSVSSTTTVKAIATHPTRTDSEVASLTITQVATPTIQNNGSNAISITSATPDATIYYTTDGSTPTTSSTLYTSPLTENVSNVTIKAIAVKENMITSLVGSGTVILQCATPVITRVGMTFTLSCSKPTDANLYYTLGGGSEVEYTGTPVAFTSDQLPLVVTAVARHSDYTQSETASMELKNGTGTPSDPYLIYGSSDFADFVTNVNNGTTASACYKLGSDVSASGMDAITTTFTGTFDGGGHTISGLSHPLFQTVDGGVVRNVMLSGVIISSSDESVGAIAGVAKGYSRIYNCGILPNDATFPEGTHPSVSTTGSYAGGIVGSLEDDSRVINCFSYADVSASSIAAGIVGRNTVASNAAVADGKYANLRTAVVNCMFYGNVSAATVYPVYGGMMISNAGASAINNYNYYSVGCEFSFSEKFGGYNCSWPVKTEYLTRYEFIRSQLNSNRELCGWWVGAPSAPSSMTTAEVQAVPKDASLMAKWVLDPAVAPYPVLKPFGYYPSPVNIDADASWRTSANEWEGKKLGTLHVTVNAGAHGSGSTSLDIPITDMDTLRADYCYRKIQLPYYNAVFGNPDGADWTAKYGGNYTDYAVTGWDITTSQGTAGTLVENWQDGYNFADRNYTVKDTKRTFAQGGYYYVPNGVTSITITAHWGKAIYLGNGDNYYDRVDFKHDNNKPGTAFTPAGTRSATLGNGETVQTGKIATVAAGFPSGETVTVYDNALVLVGNHQYCTGGEDVNLNPLRSFTIMSADFDFDDEPDYCLDWQLGVGTTRQSICPIRFDFLPVVEIGLGLKKDGSTQYYSLGCYRPLGHFEVTETALIRFGQFEFSNKNRKIDAPIILNGGIYDQYTKGTNGNAFSGPDDPITYIIIGGNVYLPTFSPGAHVNTNAAFRTRHCAVNVIGGRIDNLYLTGNYNDGVTPNKDNPHCYIDGGRFKQVAAAGKEGINGDVTFKINHAAIWEFYGGGTLADKRVTGSIDVTIDNSRVTKYCGGPKFGDMYDGKTVTTSATGTTFGVYYGGGNGGTSYVQYDKTDGEQTVSDNFNWNGTGKLSGYTPGKYRNKETGYMADYDLTITNVSTGTNSNKAIYRSYFYAAQFSATNTGSITNTLKDCTVLTDFYGGGNLGGVIGNVESTLTGETTVQGSVYGAGYSASIPEVTIREKDKTPPSIDVYTGIITPQEDGTSTTYTWTNETSLGGQTLSTSSPAVTGVGGKKYFYTEKSLVNLGAVTGNVTLTVEGNTTVEGKVYDADGNVVSGEVGGIFGGGNESTVTGNTTVTLQGNADVRGSVYGGGNKGKVSGSATVNIKE